MSKATIQQVSKITLVLEEFLRGLPPGERVSYAEIGIATSIEMNETNKGRLRVAAKRAGRIYAVIRGFGIEMSSGENAGSISRNGLVKLDSMARRQEKLHNGLLAQHAADMPPVDRHQITAMAAMFAQVRIMADGQKRLTAIQKRNRPNVLPLLTPEQVY